MTTPSNVFLLYAARGVRGLGDPRVVRELLCRGERKSRLVLIAVQIIGVDSVEALLLAEIVSGSHDRLEDRRLPYV